jgi:hypothetical protein
LLKVTKSVFATIDSIGLIEQDARAFLHTPAITAQSILEISIQISQTNNPCGYPLACLEDSASLSSGRHHSLLSLIKNAVRITLSLSLSSAFTSGAAPAATSMPLTSSQGVGPMQYLSPYINLYSWLLKSTTMMATVAHSQRRQGPAP